MNDTLKTELYEQYSEKVLRYITGKVNDRTLAEDLASEVFLKVCEKIDTFDETKSSASTWIYTIARNTLTDYYRTRKVLGEIPEVMPAADSVEDEVLGKEQLETLADAMESLDKRSRDIIILHYYSRISLKEIAERLDISYTYAKILNAKALEALKKYFI